MIVESWCVCVGRLDIYHTLRFDNGHTIWDGDRETPVFISFVLFMQTWNLVHGHGHGHGPVLDVGVVDRTCGWTYGVPKVVHPLHRR